MNSSSANENDKLGLLGHLPGNPRLVWRVIGTLLYILENRCADVEPSGREASGGKRAVSTLFLPSLVHIKPSFIISLALCTYVDFEIRSRVASFRIDARPLL